MSFKEHNNNQYTKESTEVEKYLLRIIQRYFDIENNYTNESIEAMIIESLTRFKQIVINEKGFIFSLNQQTGKLILTIKDFGGENVIDKNTAFNKDFGIDADTICNGNDVRLSDNREPLEHVHELTDIKGLKEVIDAIENYKNTHVHDNKTLLSALEYTGAKTEIDLILLEQLAKTVENYCNTISNYKNSAKNVHDNAIDTIIIDKTIVIEELEHAKQLVQEAKKWIDEIKKYIDKEISEIKDKASLDILSRLKKEKLQEIMNAMKQSYFLVKSDEVLIPAGTITNYPIVTGSTINGALTKITYIQEESRFAIGVNDVNNLKAKLYFRYEDEQGHTQTFPLPFCMQSENQYRRLLIECTYDDNNIYITSKFVNQIYCYADENNFYDENTIIAVAQDYPETYVFSFNEAQEFDCEIALIDSNEKNNFVKNLLEDDVEYYIQGYNFAPDGQDYIDNQDNVLTYTDWDVNEPNPIGLCSNIKYNTNKKWASVDGVTERIKYIVEYKIKPLSTVYNNPRIYYQAFGNKEGL